MFQPRVRNFYYAHNYPQGCARLPNFGMDSKSIKVVSRIDSFTTHRNFFLKTKENNQLYEIQNDHSTNPVNHTAQLETY